MKRNHLIFAGMLITLLFFMASCEKIGKKPSLIGQWEVIKVESFVYNIDTWVSQGTYETELYILEFNEDGTYRAYFDPNDLSVYEDGVWSHTTDPVEEGDKITLDGNDEVTIDSLTERTLVFTYVESATDKSVYTLRKVD